MAQNVYSSVLDTEFVIDTESGLADDVRETGTEEATELSPGSDSGGAASFEAGVYTETGSCDDEILYQLKVTNNLLGVLIALNLLILSLFIFVFFLKVIRNNVTNIFT